MIEIAGKKFKTKATLTAYCKYVLNNADLFTTLRGEWGEVIDGLFHRHYAYDSLTGGVGYEIKVRNCHVNPRNRQFYIEREDGSETDFSYVKCISPKSKSDRIKEILRELIREQTIEYKTKYFAENSDSRGFVICPETNLKMKRNDSHLDHYPKQFNEIVADWFAVNNLTFDSLEILSGDECWTLKDRKLSKSFFAYHEKVAEYRVVLDKVNQQRKRPARFTSKTEGQK